MFTLVMAALVIGAALPYAQLIGKLDAATSLLSEELNRQDGESS